LGTCPKAFLEDGRREN